MMNAVKSEDDQSRARLIILKATFRLKLWKKEKKLLLSQGRAADRTAWKRLILSNQPNQQW